MYLQLCAMLDQLFINILQSGYLYIQQRTFSQFAHHSWLMLVEKESRPTECLGLLLLWVHSHGTVQKNIALLASHRLPYSGSTLD